MEQELDVYHLYVTVAPHLANRGSGNVAECGSHLGVPLLFASRDGRALALACSAPWLAGSAGYSGASDGRLDLVRHKRMTWHYDRAADGNVVLTGEVDLRGCRGSFVLALGFGIDRAEAGFQALASLRDDLAAVQTEYIQNWEHWQDRCDQHNWSTATRRDLAAISAAVIRTHESAAAPGAIIASLSTPWGEVRGDDRKDPGTGGYHLAWPRDMAEAAGGYVAAGLHAEAARVLSYLRTTQLPDGHWPQNMWISGAPYQGGVQLGETALPVLLVDLLTREQSLSADDLSSYWPMIRRAAGYIVRSGPATQEDRWENENGYTPFTLATIIAALLIAAEAGETAGEPRRCTLSAGNR